MNRLIIIGASGHGKVIADIARHVGYKEIAFLDDNKIGQKCLDYPVVGKTEDALKYPNADFIVAIGNAKIRQQIQKKLKKDQLHIVTLIHPTAVISSHVSVGKGSVVMAGAVINPDTKIGDGCIINTGATVDHDNVIEDYVHISVGSHLAGTVTIGKSTWVGAGAVVSNNIEVCENCMIGAGAVVVKNIDEVGTYVGVPARKVEAE